MLTNVTRALDTIHRRASWGMVVALLLGATATAAHGALHLGVFKALTDHGVRPDDWSPVVSVERTF